MQGVLEKYLDFRMVNAFGLWMTFENLAVFSKLLHIFSEIRLK